MYRVFLHDGRVTDRIDSYVDARYISPDASAAAEVAAALGVDVATIAVVHQESTPAVAEIIPPHVSPPAPKPKVDALVDALATAATLAEIRAAAIALRSV